MNPKLHEADAARAGRSVQSRWDGADVERALAATHARLRVRRQRIWLVVAAAVVAAAGAALFTTKGASPPAPVVVAGSDPFESTTRFEDGSSARVTRSGQIVVREATARSIETELVSGAAEPSAADFAASYSVVPNPERRFVVHAGGVTVEVVGTVFRVERSGSRVRVAVSQGRVRVTAGEERVELVPGESRWFPREPESVAGLPAPSPAVVPDGGAPQAVEPSASARQRFTDLARRGDYRGAYQVMTKSPHAVGSSAEELMLAADAARLSNHPEDALRYLRRVTREHPRDARAALSAFTQGRILLSQLGRPAEAAEAFEQARRLAPAGALAEPALERQIEALNRAGNVERARALAAERAKSRSTAKDVVVPSDP